MRLYERRSGTGRPLVFVHGLGVSSRYFVPSLRELSHDFACRAPDLPGYGKSPKPRAALDVGPLADVLLGLLDEPTPLVANSFGCQIAVEAAVRRPDLATALVLVGPTADPRAGPLRHAARLVLDATREPMSLLATELLDYVRMGPRRLAQTAGYMFRDPIAAKLSRVEQPVLVVRGERDPIVPQRWATEVAGRPANGRLAVVPGAAHAVHWSHPRELRRLAVEFLEER